MISWYSLITWSMLSYVRTTSARSSPPPALPVPIASAARSSDGSDDALNEARSVILAKKRASGSSEEDARGTLRLRAPPRFDLTAGTKQRQVQRKCCQPDALQRPEKEIKTHHTRKRYPSSSTANPREREKPSDV